MKQYDPKTIEPKWQKIWEKNQTYRADLSSKKPKYFAMSMFNYPSGAGIHIGHAMNYTISDVLARFKRQQGYESYHPVGWDAFGLPAENYAIRTGISPQQSMRQIIPSYHKQYKAMGWSNDWSKEISTHEPEYYKWTQWIFSELYRKGLVYQDARMQWYCEIDNTVLADEQITSEGKCWRHDNADDPVVEKREIKQWFFKITDYANELLEAIPELDWSNSVKLAQKNWIGKSQGAIISFKVDGQSSQIDVFTTRADTIFSAAFIVLAPEHKLAKTLASPDHKKQVEKYIEKSLRRSEVDRLEANKSKTGVFTGAYAINPANDEKIPVWVADFVVGGYGTGAVFGDIHDERDFEFVSKHNIPARVTVIPEDKAEAAKVKAKEYPYTGEGILIDSGDFSGMRTSEAREKIIAWLKSKKAAKEQTNYRLRDWSVSRQRYWGAPIPIIHCQKCGPVLVPDSDLPVVLPELKDFQSAGDGRSALAKATSWLKVECPECGGSAERETDTLDTYIDSAWYFLRYLDPDNSKQAFDPKVINKWMPIDFYNGADHATAHMIYARFITRFFHKQGLVDNPEPFKRFLFNGKVVDAEGKMFSKSKGNAPDPLDIINDGYGADALRLYLMFAAPLDQWARWDIRGVPGTYRFLVRIWNLTRDFLRAKHDSGESEAVLRIVHPAIAKISEDIEQQHYNTAIAAAMELTNNLYKQMAKDNFVGTESWRFAIESLVQLIAPFAPHIAEELWEHLGHTDSVHIGHWPVVDKKHVNASAITIIVQVNGKLRASLNMPADIKEADMASRAKKDAKVSQFLKGKKIVKTITVPGKVVNFVVN